MGLAGVAVERGRLFLPAAVAAAHFGHVDAVVLLVRDGALLVLPVLRAQSGGSLLKRRNAAGDRVVAIPDTLGPVHEFSASGLGATWSDALGALVVELQTEFAG